MASTYLTRTPSSTGSQTKFTFSFWWKNNSKQNSDKCFFSSGSNSSNYFTIETTGSEYIRILNVDNASVVINYKPSRVFRDASAWYHIVIAIDTTQAGGNRVKFYTNGVRETAFDLNVEPNQSANVLYVNDTGVHDIGRRSVTAGNYMEGSLSHYNFIDGTAYDASAFGEYDANGVWTINTSPSVTYGTNGFFILKDGNSVTDQSGKGNNWTVGGGTLTKTEDNPSNNFCTWNPNYQSAARKDIILSNGNTFIAGQSSGDASVSGSIAVSSGKYYWEQRIAQVNGTNAGVIGAMHSTEDWSETPDEIYGNTNTFGVRSNGNAWYNGNNLGSVTAATYNDDIFGVGFDADNGNMYLWRLGVAQNSGNAIITGIDTTKTWIPFGICHGGALVTTSTNWGNGYFQTAAVASAGTNASENGIFEYDVPTGYTALSTKGLNL